MDLVVYWSIIIIFIVMNLLSYLTEYLNHKARFRPLGEHVQDIYDKQTYSRWLEYSGEENQFGLIIKSIRFLILLILLLSGGFASLASATTAWFESAYFSTMTFIGILFAANFILESIAGYYYTFSIEARYGFNKTTKKTFVKDKAVGLLLSVVILGGIVSLLFITYMQYQNQFILLAGILLFSLFLLINIGYVKVILPLFNKLSPLEDGELKDHIETLAESQDYTIKKIHIMDASKRSTKLNAFFSGFSRFKQVVLFDTLIEKMDTPEILAVLAHEIGHAKHKDVVKNLVFSAINLVVFLSLLYSFFTFDVFYEAFSLDHFHFGFALIIFTIVLTPLQTLLGILTNYFSRVAEYKADAYAASVTSSDSMISALKVLAKENFSNLTPHELHVLLHYSHPPMNQRIQALKG